jgi:hypothetical protein
MLSCGRTVFEGGLPDAAALAPHGAVVVTSDAGGLADAARAVGGKIVPLPSSMGDAGSWRVLLPRHVTHPALVRALADHEVPIIGFRPIEAGLEGAFWHLAQSTDTESKAA